MNYPTQNLTPGMSGDAVKQLQQYLISQGFSIPAGATGYYGDQTTAAVLALQKKLGVDYSSGPGYFGPKTIAGLSGGVSSSASTSPPIWQGNSLTGYTYSTSPATVPTPTPTPTGAPIPSAPTTPSIIGQYKGINITRGSDAEVSAQIAKIDAGTPSTTSSSTSSTTSGGIDGTAPKITAPKTVPWSSDYTLPPGFTLSKTDQGGTAYLDANGNLYIRGSGGFELRNDLKPPVIPEGIVNPAITNSSLGNASPEIFAGLAPQLVPGTPEYQAAMDKISSAYFDVMQQQMNASTEQEQTAANYNWQTLKKYIETNLKVKLSDDAFQAWDQIQSLNNQFGQQNLQGSGLQSESIDSYLNKVRRADAQLRTAAQTDQEKAQQDYYMKFATPAQIKAFVLANPDKASAWGLIPSYEIKTAMSFETLKNKYPNMTDAEINAKIATVLDENGNYRSALYQRHMVGANIGVNEANVTIGKDYLGNPISAEVTPGDYGVLDINRAKEQNKMEQIKLQNMQIDKANRDKLGSTPKTTGATSGTSAGTQFSQPTNTPAAGTQANTGPMGTLDDPLGLKAKAAEAAKNLGTTGGTAPTTSTIPSPTITAEQYKLTPAELASPTGIAEYNARIAALRK